LRSYDIARLQELASNLARKRAKTKIREEGRNRGEIGKRDIIIVTDIQAYGIGGIRLGEVIIFNLSLSQTTLCRVRTKTVALILDP